jgi:hypothetical protein
MDTSGGEHACARAPSCSATRVRQRAAPSHKSEPGSSRAIRLDVWRSVEFSVRRACCRTLRVTGGLLVGLVTTSSNSGAQQGAWKDTCRYCTKKASAASFAVEGSGFCGLCTDVCSVLQFFSPIPEEMAIALTACASPFAHWQQPVQAHIRDLQWHVVAWLAMPFTFAWHKRRD